MVFIVVALVVLALLCLAETLLLLAVLRRLGDHEERLKNMRSGTWPTDAYDAGVLVGRRVDALASHVAGTTGLVGFFSVGCDACHEQIPDFLDGSLRQEACAVVVGDHAHEVAEALTGVRDVVTGASAESLMKAAGIAVFPTFLHVSAEGEILAADVAVQGLPDVAEAR